MVVRRFVQLQRLLLAVLTQTAQRAQAIAPKPSSFACWAPILPVRLNPDSPSGLKIRAWTLSPLRRDPEPHLPRAGKVECEPRQSAAADPPDRHSPKRPAARCKRSGPTPGGSSHATRGPLGPSPLSNPQESRNDLRRRKERPLIPGQIFAVPVGSCDEGVSLRLAEDSRRI